MRPKSKSPSKQRKYQFESPLGETHKVMSANLSSELRERKGFRSLPVRKGDTVKIMRGSMKGRSGKISKVDLRKSRVYVDKIVKRKTDNTEIPVPLHPSNLMVIKFVEKDRKRLELLNRRIKDVEEKIDIDAVLSDVEEEDEEIIDLDDDEIEDESVEDDVELVDNDQIDDVLEEDETSEENEASEGEENMEDEE